MNIYKSDQLAVFLCFVKGWISGVRPSQNDFGCVFFFFFPSVCSGTVEMVWSYLFIESSLNSFVNFSGH